MSSLLSACVGSFHHQLYPQTAQKKEHVQIVYVNYIWNSMLQPQNLTRTPNVKVWKMFFLVQMDDFQVPAVSFPSVYFTVWFCVQISWQVQGFGLLRSWAGRASLIKLCRLFWSASLHIWCWLQLKVDSYLLQFYHGWCWCETACNNECSLQVCRCHALHRSAQVSLCSPLNGLQDALEYGVLFLSSREKRERGKVHN